MDLEKYSVLENIRLGITTPLKFSILSFGFEGEERKRVLSAGLSFFFFPAYTRSKAQSGYDRIHHMPVGLSHLTGRVSGFAMDVATYAASPYVFFHTAPEQIRELPLYEVLPILGLSVLFTRPFVNAGEQVIAGYAQKINRSLFLTRR